MIGTRNSIATIIDALTQAASRHLTGAVIADILAASPVEAADLDAYVLFDASRYTRNLVIRSAAFEVLVLCWPPGAASPIHDHDTSNCGVTVVSGNLLVENFTVIEKGRKPGHARLARADIEMLEAGQIERSGAARSVHRVGARGEATVSLHVYAKPLDRCLVFDVNTQSCETIDCRYDLVPAR